MTTIYDVLEDFRVRARNTRELGDLFEQLMVGYFKTDPFYTEQFSDVWLWMDWPEREGSDTGIDIVAKDKEGEGYCAIQCKFYPEDHVFSEKDLGTFLTQSGKRPFNSRLFVSTTTHWGRNADQAIRGQTIPVRRIGLQDLNESAIDWSKFKLAAPQNLELKAKKGLRPHQREAIDDVFKGWEQHNRGKLIMACGTGKTFTALKLAEELAERKKGRDQTNVLFLVPSISLIQQTLREWTTECAMDLQSFAVCSDIKVGRGRTIEDISVTDLAYPATTDTKKLLQQMESIGQQGGLTTIFSTYQSIAVVSQAQKEGLPEFDLIVCDEAHRTTGVKVAGEDESAFVRVHDNDFIASKKRLYMTATPRLYDETAKQKANEREAVVWSMDDETKFGPEFHRLGFGKAVGEDLLSDYRVLILAVDEQFINSSLQSQVADKNSEITLEDTTKIVGCWNGLAKRSGETPDGFGFGPDEVPMRRAVAFSRTIAESKALTSMFNDVLGEYAAATEGALQCEVQHVDGTQNALVRGAALDWLRVGGEEENQCRILSNARCLSEGVDVPNLDAVMFLNPRDSQVDVVQAVGRVMRKAPGKTYGYILLPIAIPTDMPADEALSDNKRYRVVWQILQALRAHDDRFNATINKIDLNKRKPRNIMVGTVGFDTGDPFDERKETTTQMVFDVEVEEWRDAIYAKIVQKVGERTYWETWAHDIAEIAERHTERVKALLAGSDKNLQKVFAAFLAGLRQNLNDSITEDQAIDMLSQHQVTRPVFEALFEDYSFASSNPVSVVMQQVLDLLERSDVFGEFEDLQPFYDSVRRRAEGIDNTEGKQRIIIELYEKFFRLAFPRTAQSLGIVYTPVELVDFIIHSVQHVLGLEFNASVGDKGVHVLDPFTGTGTFMVRLLQNGVIGPKEFAEKYTKELHANEIVLLAYYIAAINIEAVYHGVTESDYEAFEGIVLTDTFQSNEARDTMDEEVFFPQNNERLLRQKAADITVIMANPPYSVGQGSQNDGNQNMVYPSLDRRIEATYAARSSATLQRNLYDSYVRAFRWAADRIGDRGIVCFVSNGSYIDTGSFDGFRKSLVEEFSSIYCLNLRGNMRLREWKAEGGQIFGVGSQTPIAITLLVRNPDQAGPTRIAYHDIGDFLSREEKLAAVSKFGSIGTIPWISITPDKAGDWINQRDERFASFDPLGAKREPGVLPIFDSYSLGLITNRDSWAYNFSANAVRSNMARMIDTYNAQVRDFPKWLDANEADRNDESVERYIERDTTKISWTRALKADLRKGKEAEFLSDRVVVSSYRPFCKEWLYFDRQMNEMVLQWPKLFPTPEQENFVIAVTGIGARQPFSAVISDSITNMDLLEKAQCFPLYVYEESEALGAFAGALSGSGFTRRHSITDKTLGKYQAHFGSGVSKEDIFYYIYGLLHSPEYKARWATDLKKMLPRLPLVAQFQEFSSAGRSLAEWHLGYETVALWPLDGMPDAAVSPRQLRVTKMRFPGTGKRQDKTRLIVNEYVTLTGIPEEARQFEIAGRTALEWIIDRYQVKTDSATGITNDPNDWSDDPRYIVDLVARLVRVSVETMRIVDSLPPLEIIEP